MSKVIEGLLYSESHEWVKVEDGIAVIGIVGNFNNEFVVSAPNKKTTHSTLSMNYESNIESKGVLVYLEYTHNSDIVISRLSVSVN